MTSRSDSHPRKKESDSGFTLLELLAVIAIIGILAAIALPAISRIREKARIGTVRAQLEAIQTGLDNYFTEWDTYPPMGNDWLGEYFFPSEDVGTDGIGPFCLDSGQWVVSDGVGGHPLYTGPDANGTEGNYMLDPGEDIGLDLQAGTNDAGEGNHRLDGTYYQRMSMFTTEGTAALLDLFAPGDTYYHYYAGHVRGKTSTGMPNYPSYTDLTDYMNSAPTYYNRWVLYSVGLDRKDHGLHNYFLTMQDGEDVGFDGYASDVMDDGSGSPNAVSDNDGILFEPSLGENNDTNDTLVSGTVKETGWVTPGGMDEQDAPGGTPALDGARGKPVFSYDVRTERRSSGSVYAMPDGDPTAYGVIMRYGP